MKLFLYFILANLVIFSCAPVSESNSKAKLKLEEKGYPDYDRFLERAYPDKEINWKAFINAKENINIQINNSDKSLTGFDDEWITQGPGNIGARINTVAIHPEDNQIIFAGFSGGGLWKTVDGGSSWKSIFDHNTFIAIGNISFDPNDSNVVYVATGDPNVNGLPSIGNGLFKSKDLGESWEYLGLEDQRILSKIEIDPNNTQIIYVSSMGLPFTRNNTRGLFKSNDGGKNWNQILSVSDSTGFTNVIISPDNSNIVYASAWDRVRSNSTNLVTGETGGFYRSGDAGSTWDKVENGLPTGRKSRTGIAVSHSNPNNVYVVMVNTAQELQGVYRSKDYGLSFEEVDISTLPNGILGGFGWYFGKITINPMDPENIFVLGVNLWETKNGGESWEIATPNWWTYEVHADKHDLQILENGQMYLATDGGLYQSHIDSTNWIDIESIPTTQFYRTAYNPHEPDIYYGGAQDNGTTGGNESYIDSWPRIFGGDGFQMVFDPTDPGHFFAETQRGNIVVTTDGGNSFSGASDGLYGKRDWDMQYIMSPHDNNILFTGTDTVFVSLDSYYVFWEPISGKMTGDGEVGGSLPNITTLSESPLAQGVLYVGTNDGFVYGTKNMGLSWDLLSDDLPVRYVTDVRASPDNPSWAYVCLSGYKDNDRIPRIHRTKDYGATWEDISGDMPDIAVNDIFIIPGYNDDIIFVATDAGVYGSLYGGLNWQRLGSNMPNIRVYDLAYNEVNKEIVAATFARSIMSYDITELLEPSHTVDPSKDEFTFKLSPNPSIETVMIEIEENYTFNTLNIELLDLTGKILIKKSISNQRKVNLNVASLIAGNYYIKVNFDSNTAVKKIIKL